MKRRTLIRQLGAAGIVTATISGSATAKRPSIGDLDIDREFDVSSVEGWVAIGELLEPEEIASLPAGLNATERIGVEPEADSITVEDCCAVCCKTALQYECCTCCYCDSFEGCT